MKKVYLREQVVVKERPYGGSLINFSTQQKARVDPMGYEMVKCCHGRTLDEAAEYLASDYDIDVGVVRSDLEPLLLSLLQQGFLTYEYQERIWYSPLQYPVEGVTFHLTNRCNLRCRHCIVEGGEAAVGELSTDEWLRVVEQLPPFQLSGAILSGGEPFMHPGFFTIAKAISDCNIPVSICTNGTLVDDGIIEKLKSLNIGEIQVSLDGATKNTNDAIRGEGCFDLAVRTIRNLKKAGFKTSIATSYMKPNVHEYMDVFQLGLDLAVDRILCSEVLLLGRCAGKQDEFELDAATISKVRSYYWEQEKLHPYLSVRDNYTKEVMTVGFDFETGEEKARTLDMCGAGKASFIISATGEIMPCRGIEEGVFSPENVRDKALLDLWQTAPSINAFRNLRVDDFEQCCDCDVKYQCGGGCRAAAHALHGRWDGPPDPVTCTWKKQHIRDCQIG